MTWFKAIGVAIGFMVIGSVQASDLMGYPSYDRCSEVFISALGEDGDE